MSRRRQPRAAKNAGALRWIGKRIRERRSALGITQTELSRQTGLDPSAVSRMEAGERELHVTDAARIAAALNMSLDELVRGAVETRQIRRKPWRWTT